MDKIFKALSIANAGMGIGVNFQKFQQLREERALAPIKEEREAKQAAATLKGTEAETAQTVSATEQAKLTGEASRKLTGAQTDRQTALAEETRKKTAALPTAAEAQKARKAKLAQKRTDQEQQLFNDWRQDRRNVKLFDEMDQASKAYATLESPGEKKPLEVAAAQRMLIRSIEPGIINQADLQAYSPDPSMQENINRLMALQAEGKPLEADVAAFRDFAEFLMNRGADKLRQSGQAFANSPQGRKFGATEDVMNKVLRIEDFVGRTPARPEEVPGQQEAAGAAGIPLAPSGAGGVTGQLIKPRAAAAPQAPAAPAQAGPPDEATFNATVNAILKRSKDAGRPMTRQDAIDQLNAHYGGRR